MPKKRYRHFQLSVTRIKEIFLEVQKTKKITPQEYILHTRYLIDIIEQMEGIREMFDQRNKGGIKGKSARDKVNERYEKLR